MFSTIRNAWKIADLRKKILFTLMIIIIFRIGAAIPVPFLDSAALKQLFPSAADMVASGSVADTSLFSYFNALSGDAFSKATLFAMSITPYINASIILQLLTVAIPALERLAQEGEEGRKQLGKLTRYGTVVLALIQGIAYYVYLRNARDTKGAAITVVKYTSGWEGWMAAIVIVLCFTAGSALLMWLGEQINEKGIGNGISIILLAGIISRLPQGIRVLAAYIEQGIKVPEARKYLFLVPLAIIIFIAMLAFIVILTEAERRIPVQYAKRVVGRKMYGGQATHMPIKVNMSGVLPIIFASTLLSIPTTISMFVRNPNKFWAGFFNAFKSTSPVYGILYFLLIIAFSYFYVSIQYNPVEMANNLKRNNGTIPGYRPGKPTSEFISRVISKIVLIGALFLAVVAILPIIFTGITKINIALGGTSLMIVVGVAIETVRQIESQMLMRHYKGFLE